MSGVGSDSARSGVAGTSPPASEPERLVEHFFRHETGRLHGALIRMFGVENLALAEDVTQEAMLRALRTWAKAGIPPNPSAWITRVATNLARDALRHRRMSGSKEAAILTHLEQLRPAEADPGRDDPTIRDDVLRLMFVCCHPAIAPDAQVVLALKVLCGFGTGEIARAFLASEAAIEKQLTRTKQRISEAGISADLPEGTDLAERLNGVLAALYLLFGEGYKASAGERLLREELCAEAIRLATLVTEHPSLSTPQAHALLAFMLLTAARLPARLDDDGALLRLDDQDRSKWDHAMIERGLLALGAAARGEMLTEYHHQAGIAACHAIAPDYGATDWVRILGHYDELFRLKPSPIIALNRAVALAELRGPQAGLDALDAMEQRDRLASYYLLPAVRGEFHWRLGQHRPARECFQQARSLARVGPEQRYLESRLKRLSADAA